MALSLIFGLIFYVGNRDDHNERGFASFHGAMAKQKIKEQNFKEGDLESIRRIFLFFKFYGGKEVRVQGVLAENPVKKRLEITDHHCPDKSYLRHPLVVVVTDKTIGAGVRGKVELRGTPDTTYSDVFTAQQISEVDSFSEKACDVP